MDQAAIEIQDLAVTFPLRGGPVHAVRDLNLTVAAGEVFGFLGPNGAGKTTTIHVLLGFLQATSGHAAIFGHDVDRDIARARIGYLAENPDTYAFLTGRELLAFTGRLFGLPTATIRQRAGDLLADLGLAAAADRRIAGYSRGMRQRVCMAQALMNDPDLLILDEPTGGLDPLGRLEIRRIIARCREAGKTVFFSSHELSEVELVCDRIGIVAAGRLVAAGRTADLVKPGESLERFFIDLVTAAPWPEGRAMIRVAAIAAIVWMEMIRRKDIYVLLILMGALLLSLLALDVFGVGQVAGYVKDVGLLAAWVLGWILALNTSIRQLPQEEVRGTLFPLLAKPVSRLELIVGKWLGVWTVVSAAVTLLYDLLWAVVVLRGGQLDLTTLTQGWLLHLAALAILTAIGLALSTRLNPDAAAAAGYVLTGAAFLLLARIPAVLVHAAGVSQTALLALYYLLPHLELFDLRRRLVHDWGPAPWGIVAATLLYGAIMTAFFLLLAWLGYRRRRFVRGQVL